MKTVYIHADTTAEWAWKARSTDPCQPHMVRLSMLADENDAAGKQIVLIVYPEPDWKFEDGAVSMHHITRSFATHYGTPLLDVIAAVHAAAGAADRLVAYNSDFHRHVLERSAAEAGADWIYSKDLWSCAMRRATPICRVPRMAPGGGYSFPKLTVAYQHMTGHEMRQPDDPIEAGAYLINAVREIDRGIQRINQ